MKIVSLPPMFTTKRHQISAIDLADDIFDANWIGLEN